jgi:hypothetical protein
MTENSDGNFTLGRHLNSTLMKREERAKRRVQEWETWPYDFVRL